MSTFLFVDDDLAFLESIQRIFKTWSAGTPILIKTAHSVGDAIMILQEAPVNVIVIDIRMPVVDGLQFLRLLNRKHPTVQKAILTGYAEEDYRSACLAHGAALFLEKPRNTDEMKSVYAALVQLLEFPQTRGFSGIIQQASLADMLQMLCTGGNSMVMEIKSREGVADIFIREGSVIHATLGEIEGYDAFYRVMAMPGGEFLTKPFEMPPKSTITNSWEYLLMESARLLDESGVLDLPDPDPVEQVGPIPIPKTTRVTPARLMTIRSDSHQVGSLPAVPSYAATERERENVVAERRPEKSKETVAIQFSPIRLAQKPVHAISSIWLDELVLCSAEGQLIENRGSLNPGRRVDFLELFSIKMRQITGRPEWGMLEYLSIQGTDYTATVEFPDGRGVFGLVKRKDVSGSDVRAAVHNVLDTIEIENPAGAMK